VASFKIPVGGELGKGVVLQKMERGQLIKRIAFSQKWKPQVTGEKYVPRGGGRGGQTRRKGFCFRGVEVGF